jgi:hypothetical protein
MNSSEWDSSSPMRTFVGHRGLGGLGLGGEVEEVALARVVDVALAARAEDVAAEQGQRLGQLGVLLLEAVVIRGGRLEDALQLVDAAVDFLGPLAFVLGPLAFVLGPLAFVLGLPPQRVVAAEQVAEESPALGRIIG